MHHHWSLASARVDLKWFTISDPSASGFSAVFNLLLSVETPDEGSALDGGLFPVEGPAEDSALDGGLLPVEGPDEDPALDGGLFPVEAPDEDSAEGPDEDSALDISRSSEDNLEDALMIAGGSSCQACHVYTIYRSLYAMHKCIYTSSLKHTHTDVGMEMFLATTMFC